MAIVVFDIPVADKIGVNPASVNKVTRGVAGRVFIWLGAEKIEVLGTFEQVIDKLNRPAASASPSRRGAAPTSS